VNPGVVEGDLSTFVSALIEGFLCRMMAATKVRMAITARTMKYEARFAPAGRTLMLYID
jgi:hypothetical protein